MRSHSPHQYRHDVAPPVVLAATVRTTMSERAATTPKGRAT